MGRGSRTPPPPRREDLQEVIERGEKMEPPVEEEEMWGGFRDVDSPRGATVEVNCVGGGLPPLEENADLPDFTPEHAHLLLQEFYGDFPHHNDGSHLDGVVADDAIWQRR